MSDLIQPEIARSISFSISKRGQFLPVRRVDRHIEVWVTERTDPYILDEYRMRAPAPVRTVKIPAEQFSEAVQHVFESPGSRAEGLLDQLPLASLAEELADKVDLLETRDDAPIIRLVNSIIVQAVRDRASDIHIEPAERDIVVRFRVDGMLHTVLRPPKPVQAALMSRIKVMADLDIAEKRLPQDGGLRVQVAHRDIDVRVSVLPTAHGERLVLRLLTRDRHYDRLAELGMSEAQLGWMHDLCGRSHGIVLVTGPTGAGKNTTLYAALTSINSPEKNIITIEDPIEYSLEGVGQIQVNTKIGLTFASGLRSVLRQDPDVLMVGEIRDLDTAEIAIQASLTGHLVFSTLHTNDSVGAIARLVDMGVDPFLVGSSLQGVVAQRLVRRLCTTCREVHASPGDLLGETGLDPAASASATFYRPRGCDDCMQTGYRGRTAIFETLSVTDSIRELIHRREAELEVRKRAAAEGMRSLRQAGLSKAADGVTSIEEVFRVTRGAGGE